MKRIIKIFISVILAFAIAAAFVPVFGTQSVYAASKPGKAKILSVKANSSTAFTVKWKKVSGAKGYQIRYSTRSSMSGARMVFTTKRSRKIKKLKAGTKYYVQVRAYKKSNGKKIYGKWSKKKSVTTNRAAGTDDSTPSDGDDSAPTGINLSTYLAASTNCQVNNSSIKSIVNNLTAGLTTDEQKAKAIFNYVRDNISYVYYNDTKYGAVATLTYKEGNCVDMSHLLIAMLRTAGIPARYHYGKNCHFSSGLVSEHVWTECTFDGNTWYTLDPTSSKNTFGVINNWNTSNYEEGGIYASLPF